MAEQQIPKGFRQGLGGKGKLPDRFKTYADKIKAAKEKKDKEEKNDGDQSLKSKIKKWWSSKSSD